MFGILGMAIVAAIAYLVGIASASKDLRSLEDRDLHKFDKFQKDVDTVIIYASDEPVKGYIKVSLFLISIIVLFVGSLVIQEGWDEFTLGILALFLAILGPFIAIFMTRSQKLKQAVQTKQPILEIHEYGLVCHSRLCGAVREISWSQIKNYTPVLPVFGTVSAIHISHGIKNADYEITSRYVLNTLDIDIGSLVTLLEHYSNIPADEPR